MEDGIKISELTQLATLNGEGEIPIVNNDETKRINVVDLVYPIGSIYMSVNSTNPSAIFGGTWEQIQGRYLLGAGAPSQNTNTNMGSLTQEQLTWNFTAGETLGEYTHSLSTYEMPSHYHNFYKTGRVMYWDSGADPLGIRQGTGGEIAAQSSWDTKTNNAGDNQAHNTMSACLVVYMWKRTA